MSNERILKVAMIVGILLMTWGNLTSRLISWTTDGSNEINEVELIMVMSIASFATGVTFFIAYWFLKEHLIRLLESESAAWVFFTVFFIIGNDFLFNA